MSHESIAALKERGIVLPSTLRSPRDVQASEIAAAALRLAGFPEVATLTGGMRRWIELAFAVTRILCT